MSHAAASRRLANLAASEGQLAQAIAWLAIRRPGLRVSLRVKLKRRVRVVWAWWDYPGIVRVTLPGSYGELIAEPLPGLPHSLAGHCSDFIDSDCDLTDAGRLDVLSAGAEALRQAVCDGRRVFREGTYLGHGCDAIRVAVRWEWPGAFVVAEQRTGCVIARTVAGYPTKFLPLDAEGLQA